MKSNCSSSKWSETEKEVAEIIRDLYRVCLLSSIPFSWRCKRKRSSIQNKISTSPNKHLCTCTFNGGDTVVLKGEAFSPATPFSFPPSESEETKIKHSKIKISLKKKKESSLKTIEDLTKTKTLLNQEIENVKKYHDQLKIFNLNLKLKKQELLSKSNLENQQKVQLDKKQQNYGPSSIELGQNINNNNNGPIVFPLDEKETEGEKGIENRAIAAAQARQRRLNIIRLKKREQRENRRRKQN